MRGADTPSFVQEIRSTVDWMIEREEIEPADLPGIARNLMSRAEWFNPLKRFIDGQLLSKNDLGRAASAVANVADDMGLQGLAAWAEQRAPR